MESNVQLKNLTSKIGSGSTPKGGKATYLNSGPYKLIRSQNIYNHYYTPEGLAYITNEQAEKLKNVSLKKEDILINITGDSVARTTIVENDMLPGRVNQHVSIIRCKENLLDPYYLLAFLTSKNTQNYLLSLAQTGGTRAALTKKMLEQIEIPLLSYENQTKIGTILKIINEKIKTNNLTILSLKKFSQILFKHWFIDFEFPNEEGKPYKSNGGEMVDAKHKKIPKHWKVVSLIDLMDYQGGSQPPAKDFCYESIEGYIRLIQIRDYDTDKHITFVPKSNKLKTCENKDIMLARYGVSLGRILFGLEGAYNVALAKVIPKKIYYREYLRSFLSTREFYETLNNMGERSVQAGFNKSSIKSFKAIVPEEDSLIQKYHSIIDGKIDTILLLEKENKKLSELRDTLLPKLLSGEIEIPDELEV